MSGDRSRKRFFDEQMPDHSRYAGQQGLFESKEDCCGSGFARIVAQEVEPTPISKYFFSDANVTHLVQLCCKVTSSMLEKDGIAVQFDPRYQSKDALLSAMSGTYLEMCENPIGQESKSVVRTHVAKLNRIVLKVATDAMYNNFLEDREYRRTVSTPITPNVLPASSSIKGTKNSRTISSVFFG